MLRLKQARNAAGMTQREAADASGIPLGTLRRWEQGVNDPDTDALIALADLYGCSTDDILGSRFANSCPSISPDESQLLDLYRRANAQGRAAIMAVAKASTSTETMREMDAAGRRAG